MKHFILIVVLLLSLLPFGAHAQEETCEEGFRLFDHEYLATDPVCIPENPQNVLALENAAFELLLLSDTGIAGTFQTFTKDEFSATIPALAPEIEPIAGMEWPVNLELALEWQPDLIAAYSNETMVYEQLSEIAPTVVFNAGIAEGDWKVATEFWSEVFNVQDLYAEMLATYEARVAELQAALGEERAATQVSLVLGSSYFNMISMTEAPIGYILQDVGLGRPESQNLTSEESLEAYGETTFAYLSDETLNLADGDVIYLYTFPVLGEEAVTASEEYLDTFEANPLWQSLGAVQAGNVYRVGYHWTRANTYLLANAVLDDLFATLTDVEPNTPNPIEGLTAQAAAVTDCPADFRAVEDAVGAQVCIPENPQRVAALMESDLDALLALGVEPIATTNGRGQSTPPRYLSEHLGDIAVVGEFYNPNLELVLELQPDLILMGGFTNEDVLAQLNEIAPTVNTFVPGEAWQSHFTRVGEIMNLQDAAAEFIAGYEARVAEVQAALGDNAGTQFIVARWAAEGPQVMAPITFSSGVLLDLGLTAPTEIPELQEGHPHSEPLSLEAIDILDVDWAFLGSLTDDGDDATALAEIEENPLFQSLGVVQNEHVVFVDGSLWTSIGGPLAAIQVLEDVEAVLAGTEE
jgi:iron complex transport system substrate-binding protein